MIGALTVIFVAVLQDIFDEIELDQPLFITVSDSENHKWKEVAVLKHRDYMVVLAGKGSESEHIKVLLSVFLPLYHFERVYQSLKVFKNEFVIFHAEFFTAFQYLLHLFDVVSFYFVA